MEPLNTDHTDKTQKVDEPAATTPIHVPSPSKTEEVAGGQSTSSAEKDAEVAGEAEMTNGGETVADTTKLTKALRRYKRLCQKQAKFDADVAAAAAVVERERQDAVEHKNASAFLDCVRAMHPSALDSFCANVIASAKTDAQGKRAEAWIDSVKASRSAETKQDGVKDLSVRANPNSLVTDADVATDDGSHG